MSKLNNSSTNMSRPQRARALMSPALHNGVVWTSVTLVQCSGARMRDNVVTMCIMLQLCTTFYISSVPGTQLQLKCLLFRFEAILLEFLQFSGSPGQHRELTTLSPAPGGQP